MNIFVIVSNYFNSGFFGTYSTVKRARIAFEDFLANDEDIIAFETVDSYCYQFTTKNGRIFSAELIYDVLDAEFEEEICKES